MIIYSPISWQQCLTPPFPNLTTHSGQLGTPGRGVKILYNKERKRERGISFLIKMFLKTFNVKLCLLTQYISTLAFCCATVFISPQHNRLWRLFIWTGLSLKRKGQNSDFSAVNHSCYCFVFLFFVMSLMTQQALFTLESVSVPQETHLTPIIRAIEEPQQQRGDFN